MRYSAYLLILTVALLATACGGSSLTPPATPLNPIQPPPAQLLELGPVSYRNLLGEDVTVSAFAGYVYLQAHAGVSDAAIATLAEANGGTLADFVPDTGIFLIQVPPGQEGAFIAATANAPEVLSVTPLVAVSAPPVGAIQARIEEYCGPVNPEEVQAAGTGPVRMATVDIFSKAGQPCTHGDMTSRIAFDKFSGQTERIGVTSNGLPSAWDVLGNLFLTFSDFSVAAGNALLANSVANAARFESQGPIVISSSIGGLATDTPQGQLANQVATLTTYASLLQSFSEKGALDNVLLVVSAGNGVADRGEVGVDLTRALDELRKKYPEAMEHIVVVGSSGKPGECREDNGQNFSRPNDPNFIRAPGRDVPIPRPAGTPADCPNIASGTSFGTPMVANALAKEAQANPNLALKDLLKDFIRKNPTFDPACGKKFRLKIVRDEDILFGKHQFGEDRIQGHLELTYECELTLARKPAGGFEVKKFKAVNTDFSGTRTEILSSKISGTETLRKQGTPSGRATLAQNQLQVTALADFSALLGNQEVFTGLKFEGTANFPMTTQGKRVTIEPTGKSTSTIPATTAGQKGLGATITETWMIEGGKVVFDGI